MYIWLWVQEHNEKCQIILAHNRMGQFIQYTGQRLNGHIREEKKEDNKQKEWKNKSRRTRNKRRTWKRRRRIVRRRTRSIRKTSRKMRSQRKKTKHEEN